MSGPVKCVVWDLDNTLWKGILLEDGEVVVDDAAVAAIAELDRRGILHSIASRNDAATAMARLEAAGVHDYFLHPQIGWGSKAVAVARIAERLQLGLDAIAFVDDDEFERAEVASAHPSVRTYRVDDIARLCDLPELKPAAVTAESAQRRALYRAAERREADEATWEGPKQAFLATLGMRLRVWPAQEADLARAEELTVRTHQLNTTGRSYGYDELAALSRSPGHLLLLASLEDRYGTYGTIGLALVEKGAGGAAGRAWRLRLMLMSCRVLSRGVGSVLLGEVMRLAAADGAALHADLSPNARNRPMLVTLRFAGFREVGREGDVVVLAAPDGAVPGRPAHVEVDVDPGLAIR